MICILYQKVNNKNPFELMKNIKNNVNLDDVIFDITEKYCDKHNKTYTCFVCNIDNKVIVRFFRDNDNNIILIQYASINYRFQINWEDYFRDTSMQNNVLIRIQST